MTARPTQVLLSLGITLLVAAGGCRTSTQAGLRQPAVAAELARRSSDPATAFDLALFEANDRAYARARIDDALAANPADATLLIRSAMLANVDLDDDRWLADLLAIVERAPTSPLTEVALIWLTDRFSRHVADRAKLTKAIDIERLPGASTVAMATTLLSRVHALDRDKKAMDAALARGGWLRAARAVGPLAPELGVVLDAPLPFTTEPIEAIEYAGLLRRVRTLEPWRTALAPATANTPGLHLIESYVRLDAPADVEMLVVMFAPGRVHVNGHVVLERRTHVRVQPTVQRVRMTLAAGWHRVSTALIASRAQTVSLSLLGADGRAVVAEQSATPPPAGTSVGLKSGVSNVAPSGVVTVQLAADAYGSLAQDHPLIARLVATQVALSTWCRDIDRARAMLRPLVRHWGDTSGYVHMLDARLAISEGVSIAASRVTLDKALALDPDNPRATIVLARSLAKDDPDRALELADAVAKEAPAAVQPELLRFRVMRRRGWQAEADAALTQALAKPVTAATLDEAARYYRAHSRIIEARAIEQRAEALAEPGPGRRQASAAMTRGAVDEAIAGYTAAADTTARPARHYVAIAQLENGRANYKAASAAADAALVADPTNVSALQALATAAEGLKDVATYEATLARLTQLDPTDVDLIELRARRAGLEPGDPEKDSWLSKQIAIDPIAVAKTAHDPRWGESHKIHLLDRHIDYVHRDGHAVAVTHLITRLMTKEATDQAGEIRIGSETIVRALRTLKPNGQIVDVDRHAGKDDLSFSALAPGDSIEQHLVEVSRPASPFGGFIRKFYFQDRNPNLKSELFVVVAKGTKVWWHAYNGAPPATIHDEGNETIYAWRLSNVPATPQEPASAPFEEFVPFVAVAIGIESDLAMDSNRSRFHGVARTSFDIEAATKRLIEPAMPDREKARVLYAWVSENIRVGGLRDPSVTLTTGHGNRPGLLTAMLRAAGLPAEIVLARSVNETTLDPEYPDSNKFAYPLIRVALDEPIWILFDGRAEWFGKAPPRFAGGSFVPLRGPPIITPFRDSDVEQWKIQSSVDLTVSKKGEATGTVRVVLPGLAGQAIKQALGPVRPEELSRALAGWVAGFLPGATINAVRIEGQDALLGPVAVEVDVLVGRFMVREGTNMVTNRFFERPIGARAIGLPTLEAYIQLGQRKTPLFVRELNEDITVKIVLPEGASAPSETPGNWDKRSPWGDVTQNFSWNAGTRTGTLTRSYGIRSGRVATSAFAEFRDLLQEVTLRSGGRLVVPFGRFAQATGRFAPTTVKFAPATGPAAPLLP